MTITVSTITDLTAEINAFLPTIFDKDDTSVSALAEAIEYSLLGDGKRIRPVLTLAAAETCGAEDLSELLPIAASFELVHAYSLVHDDLPAMDDDDRRRGRPTSHKVYGEATAILVGDALQTRAFELIAEAAALSAEVRLRVTKILARAAGWRGMVGGQYLDIDPNRCGDDLAALRDVHDRKTGAMIQGAVEVGAIAAGAATTVQAKMRKFGRELGWLFQLVDDLLDATSSSEELGKTAGKDADSGKITAVNVYGGVEPLKAATAQQLETCLQLAQSLPNQGGRLSQIARYVEQRSS